MSNIAGNAQITEECMNLAYYAVTSDFSVLGKNINSQNMQIAKELCEEKSTEAKKQEKESDDQARDTRGYLETIQEMQKERMDKIMNIDGYQVTSEALSEVAGERLKTLDDDAKERGWSDDEKVDMAGYLLILENGTPEEQQEAIEAMKKIDAEYTDKKLLEEGQKRSYSTKNSLDSALGGSDLDNEFSQDDMSMTLDATNDQSIDPFGDEAQFVKINSNPLMPGLG